MGRCQCPDVAVTRKTGSASARAPSCKLSGGIRSLPLSDNNFIVRIQNHFLDFDADGDEGKKRGKEELRRVGCGAHPTMIS